MVQRVVTNQGVVLLPFVTSQREYFSRQKVKHAEK